ncbi:hypothetical protein HBI07_252150 [Parastagonospora nodorum]|nr:hypothetical protein HBI07_252150 [Parastagonospora nodorum]
MAGSLLTLWAWAKRERWCSPSLWDTFTSRTGRKCKMREQKATRQNTTQLTMTTSYVLLKARERSTAPTMMTGWGRAADAWKNEVVAMDLANSTWCDLSDLLALRFCFFSDSPLENMGRLTKEEAMEMRIDTTDAISKALAAANKLVALRSYVLGGATKHCSAPSAARFVIVCGFGKVDKHVFRAYNTMSVTAQRTIIRKGGSYVEKRAILLPGYVTVWGRTVFDEFHNCKSEGTIMAKKGVSNWFNATDKRDSVTGDRIYKMEDAHDASEHESSYEYKELISQGAAVAQRFMLKRTLKTRDLWGKLISGIKGDFLPYFQSCLYILEKEGLDELEASRRVIFNCFEMQAIASYPALATLKAERQAGHGALQQKMQRKQLIHYYRQRKLEREVR